jgi:hypothetical protein
LSQGDNLSDGIVLGALRALFAKLKVDGAKRVPRLVVVILKKERRENLAYVHLELTSNILVFVD